MCMCLMYNRVSQVLLTTWSHPQWCHLQCCAGGALGLCTSMWAPRGHRSTGPHTSSGNCFERVECFEGPCGVEVRSARQWGGGLDYAVRSDRRQAALRRWMVADRRGGQAPALGGRSRRSGGGGLAALTLLGENHCRYRRCCGSRDTQDLHMLSNVSRPNDGNGGWYNADGQPLAYQRNIQCQRAE